MLKGMVIRMLYNLSKSNVKMFLTAGNATITIENAKNGNRYTYKVQMSEDKKTWFVKVLFGSDNDNDYKYIGYFRSDLVMKTSGRSHVTIEDKRYLAIDFLLKCIKANHIPDALNLYHSCKCGRCGRTLTTPESIMNGIGPECIKVALAATYA